MKIFNRHDIENISGLTFELKVLYIKELYEQTDNSFLIVASSLYEANKFYQSLLKYIDNTLLFPMDDFLTSEAIASSPELKITRLETITELEKKGKFIVVTNLMGLLRYLPNKELFESKTINLSKGNYYSVNKLVSNLYNLGYEKSITVNKTGEIAVRGFVVDIFPISANNPIRIEFWGDQIDSIREFNLDTQLTIDKKDDVSIAPITEFLTTDDIDKFGLSHRLIRNYGQVYSILDYLGGNVIFNDYSQIELSYERLLEEIHAYTVSEEISRDSKFALFHHAHRQVLYLFVFLLHLFHQ